MSKFSLWIRLLLLYLVAGKIGYQKEKMKLGFNVFSYNVIFHNGVPLSLYETL